MDRKYTTNLRKLMCEYELYSSDSQYGLVASFCERDNQRDLRISRRYWFKSSSGVLQKHEVIKWKQLWTLWRVIL